MRAQILHGGQGCRPLDLSQPQGVYRHTCVILNPIRTVWVATFNFNMKRRFFLGLCAVVFTLTANATALFDVRFSPSLSGVAYTGAAALGSSTDQWNWIKADGAFPVGGSIASLKDTAGLSSGISLTWDAPNFVTTTSNPLFSGTIYQALMQSYVVTGSGRAPINVTISGLNANTVYTFAVYSAANTAGRTTRFTVTGDPGTTQTQDVAASASGLNFSVPGLNYTVFYIRSSGTGTLLMTADGPNQFDEGNLNALQFYQGTPEPASYATALLGLALLAALSACRRGGQPTLPPPPPTIRSAVR